MLSSRSPASDLPTSSGRNRNGSTMAPAGDTALLQIHDVSYAYPEREVLHHVNLSIAAGEILVLLGPNGAGKSTLVKAISGQLRPSGGSVLIGGRDPSSDPEARKSTGFVPQRIAIFDRLTVHENLDTFGQVMGVPRAQSKARASGGSVAGRPGPPQRRSRQFTVGRNAATGEHRCGDDARAPADGARRADSGGRYRDARTAQERSARAQGQRTGPFC